MLECVRRGSAHTFLPARGGEAAYLSAGAGGGSATYTPASAAAADPAEGSERPSSPPGGCQLSDWM